MAPAIQVIMVQATIRRSKIQKEQIQNGTNSR